MSSSRSSPSHLIVALARIRPTRRRIREQARGGQVLQMPLGRALRLPRPKDPPGMLFVGVQLRVDEVLKIILVIRAQVLNRAGGFAVAGPDVAGARVGQRAVVAGAFAEAIKPLRAIGLGPSPFADDGPFVGAGELGPEGASGGDVVGGAHADLGGGEDLVLMGVEKHVLVAGRGLGHEAVPIGLEVLEGVVDAGGVIAAGSRDGLVAGLVEGLDPVEIEGAAKRFVEKFDCRDDVGVGRVALSEFLKCGHGLADRIALLPINRSVAAAVVEAIL